MQSRPSSHPAARIAATAASAIAGLAAFFAFSSVAIGAGVSIVSGPTVSDAEITDSSAVVRWQTDVESTTVVKFGTTTALGQQYKKIVPIDETEITEIVHSMTLSGLQPDTTYFYVARSATADASVESTMRTFQTKPACSADIWQCGSWGTCAEGADGQFRQGRTCTMEFDCPTVTTPKPPESQACTPACTADTWTCGTWGSCVKGTDGQYGQSRSCTLTTDCPTATTPKPAERQACTPSCTTDVWSCTAYGTCDPTAKTQTRTCTLKTDCPTATTAKPAESRSCTVAVTPPAPPTTPPPAPAPAPAPAPEPAPSPAPTTAPTIVPPPSPAPPAIDLADALDVTGVFDVVELPATSTPNDPNAPPEPAYAVTLTGAGESAHALVLECRTHGISAARCAAWLEATYQDRRCLEQGIASREDCDRYLIGLNAGTFPGCEGRTETECTAVKDRALLGYLPADAKAKLDAALDESLRTGADVKPLPGLLAVSSSAANAAIWWPSTPGEGQQTSPAMVIGDFDKDGLPDDLETRLGWDPRSSDVEAGSKSGRAVLKSFFETGDKPTQYVFVDVDGNGTLDLIEDRKLLGLKTYDPAKVYLPGDTSRRVMNMMNAFFSAQGDLSAKLGVDLDGDGVPEGKVSRAVLKSFFEKGDRPTEQQFGSMIDSRAFASADLALITGHAIGQPRGAGETDPSFTVQVDMDIDQPDVRSATVPTDSNEPPPLFAALGTDTNGPPPRPNGATYRLRGTAAPNTVVVLYIYSYVPMVLTTTTDENGQYTYDVSDNVVDGEHTAYVAVTDDVGKVAKKSSPLSFFVKEAQAVTVDEFNAADASANVPTEPVAQWQRSYLIGAAVAIMLALAVVWLFIARKLGPDQPPPPPPEQK